MSIDWEQTLRTHGLRVTPQRQLVYEAVDHLGHGTPEQILGEVQRTASGINLSTVYRNLEVLEEVGLVTHAHIGHGPPTYHRVDTHTHIHVVCEQCRNVLSVSAEIAEPFAAALRDTYGFESDITHMSIHGVCRDCRERLS